jgi:hypothetical protein
MIVATALRDAHISVGWSVIFANAFVGVWAISAEFLLPLRRRELWWFIGLAQVLIFVQATLGVSIQQSENLEPPDFHLLYGFTMIIVVMMLYGYRVQMPDNRHLLYGGGSLFLMGLAIRALII